MSAAEKVFADRLKAARARMGFVQTRPLVARQVAIPENGAELVETVTKKWSLDRNRKNFKTIEDQRQRQAADRFAIAAEARKKLADQKKANKLAAAEIVSICAKYFGVDPSDLKKGGPRHGHLPYFRQMTTFIVKECVDGVSLPQLGMFLGGFDHTTILHSLRNTRKRLDSREPRAVSDRDNLRLILLGVEPHEQNFWGS